MIKGFSNSRERDTRISLPAVFCCFSSLALYDAPVKVVRIRHGERYPPHSLPAYCKAYLAQLSCRREAVSHYNHCALWLYSPSAIFTDVQKWCHSVSPFAYTHNSVHLESTHTTENLVSRVNPAQFAENPLPYTAMTWASSSGSTPMNSGQRTVPVSNMRSGNK